MAEYIMKDMSARAGLGDRLYISSAATSREELGAPVYPPARKKLGEHGISCTGHAARQLTAGDYDEYDLLIGMDRANIRNMRRLFGGDPEGKVHALLEYAGRPDAEVADPWYTGDFDAAYSDIESGCRGLLAALSD